MEMERGRGLGMSENARGIAPRDDDDDDDDERGKKKKNKRDGKDSNWLRKNGRKDLFFSRSLPWRYWKEREKEEKRRDPVGEPYYPSRAHTRTHTQIRYGYSRERPVLEAPPTFLAFWYSRIQAPTLLFVRPCVFRSASHAGRGRRNVAGGHAAAHLSVGVGADVDRVGWSVGDGDPGGGGQVEPEGTKVV